MKIQKILFVICISCLLFCFCINASAEDYETLDTEGVETDTLVGVVRNSVVFYPKTYEISVGQTLKLTPTITPSNGTLVWSSSNPCVVVTQDGYIRAVSSGTASIIATNLSAPNGYLTSDTCIVTVINSPIIDPGVYAMKSEGSSVINWFAREYYTNPNLNSVVKLSSPLSRIGCLWMFSLGNDGFYTIRSSYSMKYLICENNSILADTQIVHSTTANSSGAKWSVMINSDGTYSFIPSACTNANVLLGIVEEDEETYMALCPPSSIVPKKTEWSLFRKQNTIGDELTYGEAIWDDDATGYQYAVNYHSLPGYPTVLLSNMYEGTFSGNPIDPNEANLSTIIEAVENDFESLSNNPGREYSFYSIGQYDECNEGEYKVALSIGENGHRWYRQDADGFWSFWDEDIQYMRDYDDDGDAIIDPQYALCYEYDTFIGYFAVTPWN